MSKLIIKLLLSLASKLTIFSACLKFFIIFGYFADLLYFKFVLKFDSIEISGDRLSFKSPSNIFIGPVSLSIFLIKMSDLSAK